MSGDEEAARARALVELIDHYNEQDCPLSRSHAIRVLDGTEEPEPFLLADIEWWLGEPA